MQTSLILLYYLSYFQLGALAGRVPTSTASVRLAFIKNPVMENTQTPVFNTSATKALAGYRYIAEILTSCHTELLRCIQSDESTKETAESYGCSLTVSFVRCQKNPETLFSKRLMNLISKEHCSEIFTCEIRSWQAANSFSFSSIFLLLSACVPSNCLQRFTIVFTSDFILLMYSLATVNSSSIMPVPSGC